MNSLMNDHELRLPGILVLSQKSDSDETTDFAKVWL